jgi:hypothetical protein
MNEPRQTGGAWRGSQVTVGQKGSVNEKIGRPRVVATIRTAFAAHNLTMHTVRLRMHFEFNGALAYQARQEIQWAR